MLSGGAGRTHRGMRQKREQGQRQRRVGMIVHRALSEVFISESYPITISEVLLTKDLRIADVYILPQLIPVGVKKSTPQNDEAKLKTLKQNQVRIKQKLKNKLHLKYMPALRFFLDENFANAQRLNEILSP